MTDNSTDYTRVAERLGELREEAEHLFTKRCIEGEPMVYIECDRAVGPGHIYSHKGIAEARISGVCEYHFDKWFDPDWTEAI